MIPKVDTGDAAVLEGLEKLYGVKVPRYLADALRANVEKQDEAIASALADGSFTNTFNAAVDWNAPPSKDPIGDLQKALGFVDPLPPPYPSPYHPRLHGLEYRFTPRPDPHALSIRPVFLHPYDARTTRGTISVARWLMEVFELRAMPYRISGIELMPDVAGIRASTTVHVRARDDGSLTTVMFQRLMNIDAPTFDEQTRKVTRALRAFLFWVMAHELDECIMVDGMRVFDAHVRKEPSR